MSSSKIFVARLLGLDVFDPLGDRLGRLRDVVVLDRGRTGRSAATGLVIEVPGKKRVFVPMTRVTSMDSGQIITTGLINLRRFSRRGAEQTVAGDLFDRRVHLTDGSGEAVVEDLGLRFDPRYGLTGGEDSLFTRQLTRAGGVIRFAAGAVVTKRVPAARARRTWVLERSLRSGSSWARVRIDTAAPDGGASGRLARFRLRLGYGAKGLAKAGIDGARAGVARIRGDVPAQARYEVSSRGGLGMVVGALGVHVREYGRPRRLRSTARPGRRNA